MARGWESKDVASQVEATEAPQQKPSSGPKTPEELIREEQRKDLQLSRIPIANNLPSTPHPTHRPTPRGKKIRRSGLAGIFPAGMQFLHSTPARTSFHPEGGEGSQPVRP